MLGRLSSTDKTLRLRMRLASNPGQTGAAWHKTMFLRGACPIHNPGKSAEAGKLYWDGSWPSDQYPLVDEQGHGVSVAFIPGRLSDHNLLDDKYVYRLRMMSGVLSKAMEQGCWCELQGAYFANWKASKMVIPYGNVGALVVGFALHQSGLWLRQVERIGPPACADSGWKDQDNW